MSPNGGSLGPVLLHQLLELQARYPLQELTEKTRVPYHGAEALLWW